MRKIELFVLTAAITTLFSFNAMAGTWIQDEAGWWYDNGDSSYENNGWSLIDAQWYYFTEEGYCLVNTTTPDGYSVDENGAWITAATNQTQANNTTDDTDDFDETDATDATDAEEDEVAKSYSFQFLKPEGYNLNSKIEKGNMYMASGSSIWVYETNYQSTVGSSIEETSMDNAVSRHYGSYSSKTDVTINSGDWTRYDYTSGTMGKVVYSRVVNGNWNLVIFQGRLSDIDTQAIMAACVQ